ncbi:MAG: K(+)/H(+) antiporter NhaP [Legionellaceae bacterium]
MDISYHIILVGALLLLISIIATNFSDRIAMPILLVFLVVGMLAGEEGLGQIQFQNIQQAHLIGTIALAIILLNAGLHTEYSSIREGALPATSLAVVGTLITSILVGLFAAWLLELPWLEGFLLGAIIAPTDTSAVFSLLRASNTKLKSNIAAILEIESGSNDPLAVLLTVSLIELLQSKQGSLDLHFFTALFIKIMIGALCGILLSRLTIALGSKLKLSASLYPLLAFSSGMAIFAAAELLNGSGYLAAYFAGIIIGNSQIHHRENILRLHDSFSWLSQICIFLMLGLFVTPSALLQNLPQALLIAIFLMLIGRPIAVWLSLFPFRFNLQEHILISWIGLRGAVPIVLAINPLLVGLDHAYLYFNITFFIVIISIVLQGWTISPLEILLSKGKTT